MPNAPEERPARRLWLDEDGLGPILVQGPVEVVLPDGRVARSDRFEVAVCICRRSRAYPWCDTSHRLRPRSGTESGTPGTGRGGTPCEGGADDERDA